MGSYGIGVDRVFACFIEQNFDEKGIIWKKPLAPFEIELVGLNMKNEIVSDTCDKLYMHLTELGYEVLYDDRKDVSAGFKFNDADLMGMPVQVVVGEKNLKEGKVEIKLRSTNEKQSIELVHLQAKLKELL
jgi:prolyl-tRNA synthetase